MMSSVVPVFEVRVFTNNFQLKIGVNEYLSRHSNSNFAHYAIDHCTLYGAN